MSRGSSTPRRRLASEMCVCFFLNDGIDGCYVLLLAPGRCRSRAPVVRTSRAPTCTYRASRKPCARASWRLCSLPMVASSRRASSATASQVDNRFSSIHARLSKKIRKCSLVFCVTQVVGTRSFTNRQPFRLLMDCRRRPVEMCGRRDGDDGLVVLYARMVMAVVYLFIYFFCLVWPKLFDNFSYLVFIHFRECGGRPKCHAARVPLGAAWRQTTTEL